MRLHRFFIDEHLRNKTDVSIFDEDVIHQWKDVFRLRAGDKVILLDNTGFEYLSEVVLLAKGKAEVRIIERTASNAAPKREVWVYAATIKKDNYEWILEKGTELGVAHFVPIVSDRSEKKNLNMERAQKIVKEASEQSGRGTMPIVDEPVDLEVALEQATVPLIAFHLDGLEFDVEKLTNASSDFEAANSPIGILIGPEGGWSDKEIELFKEKNIRIYSLGSYVLRAETAAIVIPALLLM